MLPARMPSARPWLPLVALALSSSAAAQRRPRAPAPPECRTRNLVATHPDGSRDVFCGLARVTLPPRGEALVAPQTLGQYVSYAAPVADGWAFVTTEGAVLHADSFLGAPRLVGRIPCPAWPREFHLGRARLAVVANGSLWTTVGDAPVRHRFHDRVRAAAFESAAHGVAMLEHGELFVTADGGDTWGAVDLQREAAWRVLTAPQGLAVETTAGTQLLTPDGPRPLDLDLRLPGLDDRGSDFSDLDRRAARAAARATEVFAIEGTRDRCAEELTFHSVEVDPPFAAPPELTGFECRYVDHAPPPQGPPDARVPAGTPAGWGPGRVGSVTNAGLVDTGLWQDPDGHTRMLVEWSGGDAEGSFARRTATTTALLPAPQLEPWEVRAGTVWRVLGLSRRGVLLNSLAFGCSLLWAGDAGPVTAVGEVAGCFGTTAGGWLSRAAALPDGGIALVQSSHEETRTIVGALDVGPDGTVRQHRGLIVEPGQQVALGRWRGSLGVVTGRPADDRAWWFHPMAGGLPWALPAMPASTPPPCATAATPDDPEGLRVWFRNLDLVFSHADPDTPLGYLFGSGIRYEVEWRGEAACLRSVTLDRGMSDRGDAMTLEARPGNRLEGSVHDAGTARVSCAPSRALHRPVRAGFLNSFCGTP